MPHYFFHVSSSPPFKDGDGVHLRDDDAAWSMAVVSMGELLHDLDGKMPHHAEIVTTVADAIGQTLITLRFTGERHVLRRAS